MLKQHHAPGPGAWHRPERQNHPCGWGAGPTGLGADVPSTNPWLSRCLGTGRAGVSVCWVLLPAPSPGAREGWQSCTNVSADGLRPDGTPAHAACCGQVGTKDRGFCNGLRARTADQEGRDTWAGADGRGQGPSHLAALGFRALLPAASQRSRLPCLLSGQGVLQTRALTELLSDVSRGTSRLLILVSLEGKTWLMAGAHLR